MIKIKKKLKKELLSVTSKQIIYYHGGRFMGSKYAVTLVGSWSSSIVANTAKEAAELLLRKKEPTLTDAEFELVKDNVAPKVTVMLDKKTGRKVLNKYGIEIKGKKGAVKSVNSRVDNMAKKTLKAKMDLVTYFKENKKKERERS